MSTLKLNDRVRSVYNNKRAGRVSYVLTNKTPARAVLVVWDGEPDNEYYCSVDALSRDERPFDAQLY